MLLLLIFQIYIRSLDDLNKGKTFKNEMTISYINYSSPGTYSFKLPNGRYKINCYGAQGGWSHYAGRYGNAGGKGALVSGYIDIYDSNQTFFAVVGGQGGSRDTGLADGGYNGGGTGGWCERYKKHKTSMHKTQQQHGPGGGGGCTEIRINSNDISHRVLVAAGGSGASANYEGAPGGNLTGFNFFGPSTRTTQTNGYSNGVGASGIRCRFFPTTGAGCGYRGGVTGTISDTNPTIAISDSGSSYISGFPGCSPNSEMQFDSGEMVVGARQGNGYIQIDQIYQCPPHCSRCSGANKCKICDMPFRLYNGLCIPECPDKTIDRYSYCENCDSSCQSCSKESTNCTDCYNGFYFYNNKCLDKCPPGTYDHDGTCYEKCPYGTFSIGTKCEECDNSCEECINNSYKCTSCPDGKFLFNNECVDKCPERTVRDGNVCMTECYEEQFIYNGICYNECPKGTFGSGIVCEECDSSCAECEGKSTKCTNCKSVSYLSNSKCIESCSDDDLFYKNLCVSECPENTFLNGIECVDVCPSGKFGSNKLCLDCNSSCITCEKQSTLCTSCPDGTYLFNNKCLSGCLSGTYKYFNYCVSECPSGSHLSEDQCIVDAEYYVIPDIVVRKPKVPKKGAIAGLTILVLFCVCEICFLVYCIAFRD